MAVSLKPSQVNIFKLKELRDKLIELRFTQSSNFNQLKQLNIYRALLSLQEKFLVKETVVQLREAISKAMDKLHEAIANNPEEHAVKLQESYRTLKMQPRYSEELDDEFQERLLQRASKLSKVSAEEENSLLAYNQEAYLYLAKYACPRISPVYAPNNKNIETEPASMRLTK